MTKLDEFLETTDYAFTNNVLLKITIGNLREKKSYLKNIFIKPILLKDKLTYSFVYRHTDKDVTKNFDSAEALSTIKKMLTNFFYNAEMYSTTQIIYFTENENTRNQKLIIKNLDKPLAAKNNTHDKQKNRIIQADAFYLKALGISAQDGRVRAEMQHKYKQINRYVEIIEGIVKDIKIDNIFTVIDMGSGKGYLTFALYDFLKTKNYNVKVTGIELRQELVTICNNIAIEANYKYLNFETGSIQESNIKKIDMLIALHACDTATDDAIAKGISAKANYIICAPCCHKQIRKQIAPTNALKNITKHGILLERQAEMVTDTIRALILEAHGYKTKVFDFIEEEDTPKNVLIVGTKSIYSENIFKENMEKVQALKELFGIKQHYLETII